MIVTDIIEWTKKKSKIYVDYEFAFALYKGELHKYGLQKDMIMPDELYWEIVNDILSKRARLRAMNLLAKRPYTEERLRSKLKEGLYPAVCIEGAIDYVKSFGYIDDATYATEYIIYHMDTQSRKQMQQKLMTRGISLQIIRECMDKLCDENGEGAEVRQIHLLLQKRYKGKIPVDSSQKTKMLAYFLRKGYSQSTVKKALEQLDLDELYNFD